MRDATRRRHPRSAMAAPRGEVGGEARRGVLRLMFDPVVGSMFWAKMLTSAGIWMHSLVAAIVVFDQTGSTLLVGLASAAQFVPPLLLTPWSGSLADRGRVKLQILLGRALCVLGSGTLGGWMLLVDEPSSRALVVMVIASSLVVGFGFVIGGPAVQSVAPTLVRPSELSAAMALNTAPSTMSRVIGPAAGALIYEPIGAAGAFLVAGATHLVFFLVVLLVSIPEPEKQVGERREQGVAAAVRHVRRDRPTLILLVIVAVASFGAEPSLTLAPALADVMGKGTSWVGGLSAAFGVGAVIGLLISARTARGSRGGLVMILSLAMLAGGMTAVGVHASEAVVLTALPIAGCGFSIALTSATTLIQARTPSRLRGRIMALWLVCFIGARPLGSALIGAVAEGTTVRIGFLATAIPILVVVALCWRPVITTGILDESRAAPAL